MGYMSPNLYERVVEQLPKGTEVDFHKDGEPLLHPKIDSFIQTAKNYGFFTHIVTNGILLNKWKERIVDSGLDLLTVSLIDDIPHRSINQFMEYKGDRKPLTQLKCYQDYGAYPLYDKIILRELHNWTDDEERKTRKPCSKLLNYCAVNWDGGFAICCVDYKREMVPFNLNDTPLEKGLEFNKKLYEQQEEGTFLPPCTHCNYFGG